MASVLFLASIPTFSFFSVSSKVFYSQDSTLGSVQSHENPPKPSLAGLIWLSNIAYLGCNFPLNLPVSLQFILLIMQQMSPREYHGGHYSTICLYGT